MHYLYIIGIGVNVLSGERAYNMAKYIVYGRTFEDNVEKIDEYDDEDDANDRLAFDYRLALIRQKAEYKYEWIEER